MALLESENLQHFYINEEQSVYLLSHRDAQKLKDWLSLCEVQLQRLGYENISLIGKGAYGFVFAGQSSQGLEYVFKFSRITLAKKIQERLEEEGYMLSQVQQEKVPAFIDYQRVRGQSILMMSRARGVDLDELVRQQGRLPARLVLKIAAQMVEILAGLRSDAAFKLRAPLVHGDIKPSNIVFDPEVETVSLIDWGAAVFAQLDHRGQHTNTGGLNALSADLQHTNAKLGDVYFIGEDQLKGHLSSPRFDEQGLAGTLYALASGQGSRFGKDVIRPESLGLPIEFARTLSNLLGDDDVMRKKAGDYLFANMQYMKRIVPEVRETTHQTQPLVPLWLIESDQTLETVVYSSRKSFLRQEMSAKAFASVDKTELDKYYKNYLSGMADTEKAFITAVSHLGRYPVVGGLAIRWQDDGVYIDSSLNLADESLRPAFIGAVNNMVYLAKAINKKGVFKSCIFDARKTLHIERDEASALFNAGPSDFIPFEISEIQDLEDESRLHSYFEDGDDPDEMLVLPDVIMERLTAMNKIHHTGCIIFESVEEELKIHNYLKLLDASKVDAFSDCLADIMNSLSLIEGEGVSGFMKLPYKDTKFFR